MNELPYAEGLLCASSVIGHFQEQLSCGRWLRGMVHEATVAVLSWPEPRPGSMGVPWLGVSSKLEGPSVGVTSASLVHSVPSPGSCLLSSEWLPL